MIIRLKCYVCYIMLDILIIRGSPYNLVYFKIYIRRSIMHGCGLLYFQQGYIPSMR